ncbi:hypothetical protein ACG0W5_23225, partial [Klebsiella pneumoniae]
QPPFAQNGTVVNLRMSTRFCTKGDGFQFLAKFAILPQNANSQRIFIQQGKTGIKQIKAWTERLSAAVDICREWGQDGPVIRTMYGERYSYKGFNEAWRKARNAASEELGRPLDCTFHDLKAKGISDYEGSGRDKQKFSGHKTESQVLVYDRKVKISPTLNKKMR